ncbi:MAG: ferrous iron transport protein A [Candidatus Obscuribacterales bacterium]|nr:ferrous iron transport protein A [Cyanobacteria bacterium SZAS LIN-5]RTL44758.1 MAG: ferrous iron transport protein A [Candidatus Melainabacteria bacterium]
MTLSEAKDGQWFIVERTTSDDITYQALRFGIGEGSRIQVQKNIPGGPIIISKNQLEIAIGRQLANFIEVSHSDLEGKSKK